MSKKNTKRKTDTANLSDDSATRGGKSARNGSADEAVVSGDSSLGSPSPNKIIVANSTVLLNSMKIEDVKSWTTWLRSISVTGINRDNRNETVKLTRLHFWLRKVATIVRR